MAIRTRENFKLWRVNDEVELGDRSEEALQVVTTLLNEDQVSVAEILLWRDGRNWDARPSLRQTFVQQKELVVSSRAFKSPFPIYTRDLVNNLAA